MGVRCLVGLVIGSVLAVTTNQRPLTLPSLVQGGHEQQQQQQQQPTSARKHNYNRYG
jgi:hypothetical protein